MGIVKPLKKYDTFNPSKYAVSGSNVAIYDSSIMINPDTTVLNESLIHPCKFSTTVTRSST